MNTDKFETHFAFSDHQRELIARQAEKMKMHFTDAELKSKELELPTFTYGEYFKRTGGLGMTSVALGVQGALYGEDNRKGTSTLRLPLSFGRAKMYYRPNVIRNSLITAIASSVQQQAASAWEQATGRKA